ncbi:hypothetical protein KDX16_18265 [Burkholderia vietnamiensis]|uniref:hypothetical protein n=1 Tax=Burkholderia vietnamiensis TaxID=60552 RepID=UPI000AD7F368|nr:hypothetical protein [Burkholderia vietnamiensis]MBR7917731.1 hypothetical protein [Burkholderia vietnamiensis]
MAIKKIALCISAMAIVGVAHADQTTQTINILADIPTATSFVQPYDGWGPHGDITFEYDVFKKALQSAKPVNLKMENNVGGSKAGVIKASLGYPAVLSDGTAADDIPVDVKIHSESVKEWVKLTTTPQKIYENAKGDAENGEMWLIPDAKAVPKAGAHYEGTVDLVFDFEPATT